MAKEFKKKGAASPAAPAAAPALVRLARLLARQAAWEVLTPGLEVLPDRTGKDIGVAIPILAMDFLTTTKQAIR